MKRKLKRKNKKKKGFTLVELVTVIIILGIVALIAIPVANVQLKQSRKNIFKLTCEKIFGLDEKYELVQELIGAENECVTFDFDKDIASREEIDGEIYEPVELLGLDNTDELTGQYRICKGKSLVINNSEFTCVYDANNKKVLNSKSLVDVPLLTSVEVVPRSDQIQVIPHTSKDVKNYYYKIDDEEYIKTTDVSYIFTGLTPETDYKISVYVEDENEIKSNVIVLHTTTDLGYTGIPDEDYEEGDTISYANTEFIVVKDSGDKVTVITKYNVTTGKFGDTTVWADSSAKSYLNTDWVESNPVLKNDVEKGGIIYDDTSNSYVRMIKREEISSKLKNYSNTPFWTMTPVGSYIYYALKNANISYSKYTVLSDTNKTIYVGTGDTLDSITKTYQVNTVSSETTSLKEKPNKTQVVASNTVTNTTLATGYDSYSVSKVNEERSCNCVMEDCDCEDYSCDVTNTSTSVVYGSYCTGSRCAGDVCDWSTCAGSACGGYASTSCGKTYCGKGTGTSTSCNTYSYSAPGCRSGVQCMTTTQCGPKEYTYNKSCATYCQAGCTNSYCTGSACAGWRCTGYVCNGYSTTVKSTNTIYNTSTSTCTTCHSQCEKCDTCAEEVDKYEATGNKVTCDSHTVSETTDVIGIRAVLTIKKQRKGN